VIIYLLKFVILTARYNHAKYLFWRKNVQGVATGLPKVLLQNAELVNDEGPYYKSKLELKSNSSEILVVTSKFISYSALT